jgi:hypothetical protein
MTSTNDRAGAARLHAALGQPDTLSCAEAEAAIALLVEAEAMGQDVDDDPVFVPILRHLDRCADCLALYEAVSEDYAATLAAQRAPRIATVQPFAATRPAGGARRFEFTLPPPVRRPHAMIREASSSYGAPTQPDVEATRGDDGTSVRVVVRHGTRGTRWIVNVSAGDVHMQAQTDADGVAVFDGVPAAGAVQVSGYEADADDAS